MTFPYGIRGAASYAVEKKISRSLSNIKRNMFLVTFLYILDQVLTDVCAEIFK